MAGANTLILEVGVAVGIVAVAGLISNRLRFSVIPFFIVVGMLLGQHAPTIGPIDLSFTLSMPYLDFMGRLGVLFLLFYLGLEFSVGRLIKSGKAIVTGGSIYVLLNFCSGLVMGWLMNLSFKETMVVCGVMTSSSTAIVAKVLTDLRRTANPETEVIMGMIMFDDLFIAMHISFLSGLLLTGGTSVWKVAGTCALALGFILIFLIGGRKVVPSIDRLLNEKSSEIFILVIFGLLFLVAGFSEKIHVAEAIGALMAGLVLADSRYIKRIEHMVLPYKDFFGAMFFFYFGLSIDPWQLTGAIHWGIIAAILTITVNVASGYFASIFSKMPRRASFDIGFTLAARGEFSIIMVNIALAASVMHPGMISPIIQSFVVVYVLILSIVAPLLTKDSRKIWNLTFGRGKGGGKGSSSGKTLEELEASAASKA